MTQYVDNEPPIEHRETAQPKKGQRQRRVRRSTGGEALLTRESQVIQAQIVGNPKIKEYTKHFEEKLALRRRDFKPNE